MAKRHDRSRVAAEVLEDPRTGAHGSANSSKAIRTVAEEWGGSPEDSEDGSVPLDLANAWLP